MPAKQRRQKNVEGRMSLGQHLLELRKRLFISALAIVVGMVIGFIVAEPVIRAMSLPISELAEKMNASLNFETVTSGFDLYMKIALTVGIVVSAPVWLYQIWAFLVPGLKRREIGYALGFLGAALPLFFGGAAAGWFVMPHIVELMAGFIPEGGSGIYTASYFFDFVLKLVLAVGIAFVLPVFLVLLNFVGILSASSIIRSWRWAILAIMVFCALATPAADVVSMFLLAIPMVILYFAAYGVAWVHDKRAARRVTAPDAEYAV